ncbi:hypothetical protein DSO57_1012076 [Entomophthora muscae]|uniref:Uncharacterized protein n=1 Tax=Entomophthora muscae TaxID=34485 RepID=A0ACC2TTU8_9FUNG|nr:hypothetical protein DSO57_1012076 [Entomophthora muscae]
MQSLLGEFRVGLRRQQKGTIMAFAVIVPFALPRLLLSDSPTLRESEISLKKEGPRWPSVFLTSQKINNTKIYFKKNPEM